MQQAIPLPWQQQQWQQLSVAHQQQHLAHGILLRGMAGTGKLRFALAFAQWLQCEHPQPESACGQCKSCRLHAAGTHPDSFFIAPEAAGKQIKVDQIRELQNFASKRAQFDGYRVMTIAPAEAMNLNAANALLKLLEEPGDNAVLILVSHQVSGLLATIRSRCQAVNFPLPDKALALGWLQQPQQNSASLTAHNAEQLLDIANGAPLSAQRYAEGDWLNQYGKLLVDFCALLHGRQDPVQVAENWQQFPLPLLVDWWQSWLIAFNRYAALQNADAISPQLQPLLQLLTAKVSLNQSQAFYDQLCQARALLLSQANPNLRLLLESLLLRWCQLAAS